MGDAQRSACGWREVATVSLEKTKRVIDQPKQAHTHEDGNDIDVPLRCAPDAHRHASSREKNMTTKGLRQRLCNRRYVGACHCPPSILTVRATHCLVCRKIARRGVRAGGTSPNRDF